MLTPEQKEARKSGVGGTDISAIMGLNPWKTGTQVYLEKRGELEEEELDSEVVHFGQVLEDVVADEYARRNDCKVQRRNELIRHPEYEFMIANIDRKRVGIRRGVECKTADKFTRGKWGESGTDEVPDHYLMQSQHYMTVLGYEEWDLAVLIGGNEYRQYPLKNDPELADMMTEACKQFWHKVVNAIPPEIDFEHPGAIDLVKRMYPGTNGKTIVLPPELLHWHKVLEESQATIKKYTSVADTCKARILAAIGENAVGIIPGAAYKYTRSTVSNKGHVVQPYTYTAMRGSKHTEKK